MSSYKFQILVVDDDPLIHKFMASELKTHHLDFAADPVSAATKLEAGGYDLCFIDLQLGKQDKECTGLSLIPKAVAKGIYSVVMSGFDSEANVTEAYSRGCSDFYAKGDNAAINIARVLAKFSAQRSSNLIDVFSERFITKDPDTRADISAILQHAPSDLPLLLLGPSGAGKTWLAPLIHEFSGRQGQFVSLNCAAFSEQMLEAELFGYRKGAFTDAISDRKGQLDLADQGTLFLDEIGSMSLAMQAKLLKAIEEKSFYPLGSEVAVQSDFRVIGATLEDPKNLMEKGSLRADFFNRLRGAVMRLKPLSERSCDIFPLIEFMTRGRRRICFTPEAKGVLMRHWWPGNIRDLKLLVDHLSGSAQGIVNAEVVKRALRIDADPVDGGDLTEAQYRLAKDKGLSAVVDRITEQIVQRSLNENHGVRNRVVEGLGISRRRLFGLLKANAA